MSEKQRKNLAVLAVGSVCLPIVDDMAEKYERQSCEDSSFQKFVAEENRKGWLDYVFGEESFSDAPFINKTTL